MFFRLTLFSVVVGVLASACLQAPRGDDAIDTLSVLAITARDTNGNETAPDSIVRRPAFEVLTSVGLAPSAPPIFVFDGDADADLREDLSKPPLRIATAARQLAATITVDSNVARVTLLEPLDAGQTVTVAIAAWVIGAARERWDSSEPFLQTFTATQTGNGGAAAITSWPGHGAAGVAPNLAYAALGFDGAIASHPDTITFENATTERAVAATIISVGCEDVGLVARTCFKALPGHALAAVTTYVLHVTDAWVDSTGTPLDAWATRFTTADRADTTPPGFAPVICALDEARVATGCALITDSDITMRVALDEPAVITWSHNACASSTRAALGGDAVISASELNPSTTYDMHLSVTDSAGNRRSADESLTTHAPLESITVTEVRADPKGPEPQQEYVELFNYGTTAVDLLGFSITDDAFDDGDTIDRNVILHPGGRVLLVADDFDAADPRDIQPASSTILIRLGTSIANGGLSNSGEPLYLRNALGVRISEVPSLASVGAGACIQRVDEQTRDGSLTHFVHDADHPCTPGL